jgi:glycosyltransferase involved in cell wall biosynthesis
MQYATGDVIVSMDTDGQHSPDDIFSLIKPIFDGKADYTIGSRYLGSYHYRLPIVTRLGEILVEKFFRVFFGIKVMNNQNGFRAFTKELIPVFSNAKFLGYAFCTEQILQAKLSEHKVLECPIKVYNREYGYSKIKLHILTLNILASLLIYYLIKFKLNLLRKRKTIKGFLW